MKLFCHCCGALHTFTAGEVERIVYALDAEQADAKTDNEIRGDGDAWHATECYEVMFRASHDTEVYYEHVEACVEARREGGV